jgi:hypothetical protein
MMPFPKELVSTDLRSFAAWYRSDQQAATLSPEDGRVLLGFFVSRLLEEVHYIGPHEWEGLADTLERAITLAGLDREGRAKRLLNLTLALVNAVGPSSEHSLRNPDVAAAVFLDALPMDFAEASALAPDWQNVPLNVADRLQSIKILLLPVVGFADQISDGPAKDSVRQWMTLLDQLPP